MLEMFEYEFMRRAFIVGFLLAVILPCVGLPILLKRLSMTGDTLSHSSLAGVAVGLAFGFHPLFGSLVACIIGGLSIEFIRKRLKAYEELSTVIVLAASIGIAGIFSGFSGGGNLNAYLFGSIVTISNQEFILVLVLSFVILALYLLYYDRLYLSIFDAKAAELMGIPLTFVNGLFTVLSAATIALTAKTIGSLIVSSLLVIPVITAMSFTKTYKQCLLAAIALSAIYVFTGLFLSYYLNLKPGSLIVLIAVKGLIISLFFKKR